MKSKPQAIGTLLSSFWAFAALSPAETALAAPNAKPLLHMSGGRDISAHAGAETAKLDSTLSGLSAHLSQLATQTNAAAQLRLVNPAARFMQRTPTSAPLVLVDAVTRGDPERLKAALVALGLQHPAVYLNIVSGWLPVNQLAAAAAQSELHSMRASMPHTRSGAITSQGDFAQHSDVVRSTYSKLDGTGITVGALSDSFNCYAVYAQKGVPASGLNGYARNGFNKTAADDTTSGDLPAQVNVIKEADADKSTGACMNYGAPQLLPYGDEGRAMLQIVHDVAPGAGLAFYTAEGGEADFASGIGKLADAGAKVIVDDVGYFAEPFFQDGAIAQAIDAVVGKGVAYFSAAGNDGTKAYYNPNPAFPTPVTSGSQAGESLLNFDVSGGTTVSSLQVGIPALKPGFLLAIVLQWDQPYVTGAPNSGGATSRLDMCITGTGADIIVDGNSGNVASCTGLNNAGVDPIQTMIVYNPANASGPTAAQTINISVGLANASTPPGKIKLAVEGGGLSTTFNNLQTYTVNPTLQGHPGAAGAAAVGAAAFWQSLPCSGTQTVLETYSSRGGDPILFDKTGARLATPITRQKPNFVAPDGGNDTFLGYLDKTIPTNLPAQCMNDASFPNFYGTSAAAPHAAAVAALMLQANSSLTPAQIYSAIQTTAAPMPVSGGNTPDYNSGYGFIQANSIFTTLAPGAPAISLASSSVTTGASTTLTWSSPIATSCTASGAWSGTQATSGSISVTAPTTAGTQTYSLTCKNANGTSPAGTATLTATAPPASGGGGGGALGPWTLLSLGLITAMSLWAPARPRSPRSCRARTAVRYR